MIIYAVLEQWVDDGRPVKESTIVRAFDEKKEAEAFAETWRVLKSTYYSVWIQGVILNFVSDHCDDCGMYFGNHDLSVEH